MSELSMVREKIAKASTLAGSLAPVELVAVSKTQTVAAILKLHEQGQSIFGENYVQEMIEKKTEIDAQKITGIDFHFIGHLQSNKVKTVIPHVSTIHSVDSIRLYEEIVKRAEELKKKISIYFQVNVDREASKGGFPPEGLADLAYAVDRKSNPFVKRIGLMAIPDPQSDGARAFREMQKISQKHGAVLGHGLSIGMSKDYEIAITYGATSVRVGTALFGSRD